MNYPRKGSDKMKKTVLAIIIILALFFASSAWAAPGNTPDDPIIIRTATDLDNIRINTGKYYKLNNDIDLTAYLAPGGAGYAKWGAEGWEPIDSNFYYYPYGSGLDGDGHKITGLWISRDIDCAGLFGYADEMTIKNLGVEIADAGIKGKNRVGGLIGFHLVNNGGTSSINNCYVIGNVTAIGDFGNCGGMIGNIIAGQGSTITITNCYAIGNVSGNYEVGGLVGFQDYNWSSCTFINCYAAGNVSGISEVGGLIGFSRGSSIINCYATGDIIATYETNYYHGVAGGLVGELIYSTMTNSYATGNVSGDQNIGGLVGRVRDSNISNCYATGNAMLTINNFYYYDSAGGLVGLQDYNTSITNCYATGNVIGSDGIGGLVGLQSAINGNKTIMNCYAMGNVEATGVNVGYLVGSQDINVSNIITNNYRYQLATINGVVRTENTPNGIHGGIKTMNELLTKTTYTSNGWLFNDSTPIAGPWYWDGIGYPKLKLETITTPIIYINSQPQNTTVTAGSISGSLSVVASISPSAALSYQWYSNAINNNTSGTAIAGATNASFAIPRDLTAGTYYYYCVVSATGATPVTSNVATVRVDEGIGCNAVSYGYLVFALIGISPFILRKKK
jgi:hypothetical protein